MSATIYGESSADVIVNCEDRNACDHLVVHHHASTARNLDVTITGTYIASNFVGQDVTIYHGAALATNVRCIGAAHCKYFCQRMTISDMHAESERIGALNIYCRDSGWRQCEYYTVSHTKGSSLYVGSVTTQKVFVDSVFNIPSRGSSYFYNIDTGSQVIQSGGNNTFPITVLDSMDLTISIESCSHFYLTAVGSSAHTITLNTFLCPNPEDCEIYVKGEEFQLTLPSDFGEYGNHPNVTIEGELRDVEIISPPGFSGNKFHVICSSNGACANIELQIVSKTIVIECIGGFGGDYSKYACESSSWDLSVAENEDATISCVGDGTCKSSTFEAKLSPSSRVVMACSGENSCELATLDALTPLVVDDGGIAGGTAGGLALSLTRTFTI